MLSYFIASVAVSITLALLLSRLAPAVGLLDRAGGHKLHDGEVPVVGGLAMGLAILGIYLVADLIPRGFPALAAGGLLLLAVGFIDDRQGISYKWRFAAQIAATVLMMFGGPVVAEDIGSFGPGGVVTLGIFSVPFTLLAAVGVINALNMSDGVDGLASSLVLVPVAALALLAAAAGRVHEAIALSVFGGAVFGFWLLNARWGWRGAASVFMGDAGSMFLGLMLIWHIIALCQGPDRVLQPVTTLWIFALPVLDTVAIMFRRILRGRSPFAPDREHLHHILLLAGVSHRGVTRLLTLAAVLLAGIGVAAEHNGVPAGVMLSAFIAMFIAYFFATLHAWRLMKQIRRLVPG